jgi:Protein of unknown function DUF86
MGDKLIHDYIGVTYTIVWDIVKNKIPEIRYVVSQIIEKSKNLASGFGSKKQTIFGQTKRLFEFDAEHRMKKTLKYGQTIDLFWPKCERLSFY